jgi:hypothetical protein
MRMSTAVALVLLVAPHTSSAQTLEGVWRGRIEDRSRQPVDFEIRMGPRDAEPAGRLQPLGRGAANTFFVDAARLSADSLVRIEIQTLRIVIEGKLQAGGQVISGTWTQFGSDRKPVHLTRATTATPPTFFDPLVEIRIL